MKQTLSECRHCLHHTSSWNLYKRKHIEIAVAMKLFWMGEFTSKIMIPFLKKNQWEWKTYVLTPCWATSSMLDVVLPLYFICACFLSWWICSPTFSQTSQSILAATVQAQDGWMYSTAEMWAHEKGFRCHESQCRRMDGLYLPHALYTTHPVDLGSGLSSRFRCIRSTSSPPPTLISETTPSWDPLQKRLSRSHIRGRFHFKWNSMAPHVEYIIFVWF